MSDDIRPGEKGIPLAFDPAAAKRLDEWRIAKIKELQEAYFELLKKLAEKDGAK